jgi:hypothetical protein
LNGSLVPVEEFDPEVDQFGRILATRFGQRNVAFAFLQSTFENFCFSHHSAGSIGDLEKLG